MKPIGRTGGPLRRFFCLALALLAVFPGGAWADIDVNALAARVRVTPPQGQAQEYAPASQVPDPADGSLIEVLEGSADVSLGERSHAVLRVGPVAAWLKEGDFLSVSFDPASGLLELECLGGEIDVDDSRFDGWVRITRGGTLSYNVSTAAPR